MVMDPEVQQYLKREDNTSGFHSPQDALGRWLLPGDEVVFTYRTDEGAVMMISGLIVRMNPQPVIQPTPDILKILGEITLHSRRVIRCPKPMPYKSLDRKFSAHCDKQNVEKLMSYGRLHIQGKPIGEVIDAHN